MKRNKINKKKVFVGMSGGVDSSVSAALLKEAGHEVVGVFIRTWHPDFIACNEEEERRDAMRVAAHLDIPFLTFDFEDVYKNQVADYMIYEYRKGRTPNPDVMCNREVKFGAFLKKALSMGADYVATGHYAINENLKNSPAFALGDQRTGNPRLLNFSNFRLLKGGDPSKDQSYFLWTLRQEQLEKILFPVGDLKKSEVRKLAKKFKLPVAEKKDSQGICFLGDIDLKDFLKHYIKTKKGEVLLVPSESEGSKKHNVIGWHNGAVFNTLGERHGFTITKKGPNDGAYYVVAKDIKKNTITVSQNRNLPDSAILTNIGIEKINWISGSPEEGKIYQAQIRYHGEFLPCKIKYKNAKTAQVFFEKPVLVASGQSCVFYDDDVCMGGGIVI